MKSVRRPFSFGLLACLCFALLAGLSCREDPFELIDPTLRPYLEAFKDEAEARNFDVNYRTRMIEGRLSYHPDDTRLGWCDYNGTEPNKMTINTLFWEVLDDLGKEKLVFQELGHCVLFRQHNDVKQDDGYCESIMHSGQACADNYTLETRADYLDELFFR